jgi:tape measure domain-containing protein
MSALSWAFKVTDMMSGPASRASAAVDKTTSALTKADKAARQYESSMNATMKSMGAQKTPLALQSTPKQLSGFSRLVQLAGRLGGNEAAGGVLRLGSALTQVDGALGKVGLSLGGVATTAAMGLAAGLAAVVAAALAAGAALGALAIKGTYAFARFAVEVGAFRETSLTTLEAMLKSKTAAEEVYASAKKMAATTPFATKDVVEQYKQLLALGFKQAELERTFRAVGNLAAVRGDPQIMGQLTLVMGQIRAAGRLMGGEILQLQNAGLGKGDVFEALAKKMGKSLDEVRKMQEAGKIDSETALDAIITLIEDKYGTVMGKQSETIVGLWSTVLSRPFELMDAAMESAAKKGKGLAKFYDSLKDAIRWARDLAFDDKGNLTDRGQKIVAILERMGGVLHNLFGDFDSKKATEAFDKILIVVEKVMPHLEAFGKGLKAGFLAGIGPLMKALGGIDAEKDAEKITKAFEFLGKAIGFVAGAGIAFTAAFGAVLGGIALWAGKVTVMFTELPGKVLGAVAGIYASVTGFVGSMFGAGMNLALGFASGILAGISSVISAAKSLGQAAKNALSSFLQEKSPSRLFWKSGVNAALGVAGGMDAGTPTVERSAMSMIAPPQPKQLAASYGAAAAASGGGAGGGRPGMQVRIENININGGGDRSEVKRGMLEAWEEIALEMGLQPST